MASLTYWKLLVFGNPVQVRTAAFTRKIDATYVKMTRHDTCVVLLARNTDKDKISSWLEEPAQKPWPPGTLLSYIERS